MSLEAEARPLDRRVVITALGIAQILAWGTSFYFPAVFATAIVADTGWSLGWVVSGTSIGLLVAGLISPQVGKIIDKHGGRPVLLASSLFLRRRFCPGAGLAPNLPLYLFAWALIGIGMGTGLYDAVFAALGRLYGSEARGPITNLTLFGGFASTVCWPLSAFMIDHVGWRVACFIYAGLHLAVALPLQMAVVPASAGARPPLKQDRTAMHDPNVAGAHRKRNPDLRVAGRGAVDRRRHRLDRDREFHDLPAGEGRGLRAGRDLHLRVPARRRSARAREVGGCSGPMPPRSGP